MTDWQPGAPIAELARRATLLAAIRAFFAGRKVMEVTAPVLGGAGVTDVHLENLTVDHQGTKLFLQTSPEYAMKRLLAAGSGAIFSLGPAFRGREAGARHNPEFTLLEWYRPGFTLPDLMAEVEDLLLDLVAAGSEQVLAGSGPVVEHCTYAGLFQARFATDPHLASQDELRNLAAGAYPTMLAHIADHGDAGTRADLLDLLFSQGVEPGLVAPTFVTDFPACQAALAEVSEGGGGALVAKRFELFWHGTELANGYLELRDPGALRLRFEANNVMRARRELPLVALDEKLLAAIAHLPSCSGVALGVDRLHMLVAGSRSIDEVITFGLGRL